MSRSYWAFPLSLIASIVVVALCLSSCQLRLLPARQSTFTLLYTGDVEGYVEPCG